jgi:hypothetical protein
MASHPQLRLNANLQALRPCDGNGRGFLPFRPTCCNAIPTTALPSSCRPLCNLPDVAFLVTIPAHCIRAEVEFAVLPTSSATAAAAVENNKAGASVTGP